MFLWLRPLGTSEWIKAGVLFSITSRLIISLSSDFSNLFSVRCSSRVGEKFSSRTSSVYSANITIATRAVRMLGDFLIIRFIVSLCCTRVGKHRYGIIYDVGEKES